MKIRHLHIIAVCVTICLLFASCKKNTKPFVGEYTYQTDGLLQIQLSSQEIDIPWKGLGQMQILKDKDERGKLIIIKKSLTGEISTISATIDKNIITLEDYQIEKEITIPLEEEIKGKAKITVSSKGKLIDNTIIFSETHLGFFSQTGGNLPVVGRITGDNIQTIARLND